MRTGNHCRPEGLLQLQLRSMKLSVSDFCLTVIFACLLLSTVLPGSVTGIIILAASALLIRNNELYLVFPAMLFYYENLGLLMGMSVHRYFSLMFLGCELLWRKRICWRRSHWLLLLIYVAYSFCVVLPDDVRKAVFLLVDVVCMLMLTEHYLGQTDKRRRFFTIYTLTALCSFVTGVLSPNSVDYGSVINGQYVTLFRNNATFEDPNYMGYFFTTAVFATVTLKLFTPRLRTMIVCALNVMMFTTLSMTAIVVNVLVWLAYLFSSKKISLKILISIVTVVVILVAGYVYGLENPDTPVLGMLCYRIQEKLMAVERGDMNVVTTNRTFLTTQHLEYFWNNQSVFRMLVGMNAASLVRFDLDGVYALAHNEYVALLLNVGIIGTVIMLGYLVRSFVKVKQQRRQLGRDNVLFFSTIKLVWILYAMTLTFFGDYRFMLLFFL